MTTSQQLLIIAPDQDIELSNDFLLETAFALLNAEPPSQWRTVADAVLRSSGFLIGPSIELLRKVASSQSFPSDPETRGALIYDSKSLVIELLRSVYSRELTLLLPEAMFVAPSDPRLTQFTCTDGSFMNHTIYVRHPTDSNFFIRLADFHSYLVQEKRSEFFRLAAALGAREVKLLDSKENIKGANASASFNEPTGTISSEAQVDVSKQERSNFNLSASFKCATAKPSIPKKLRWLGAEPLWQAMVEARLNHWVEKFRVSFVYSQDFNVNTSLVTRVTEIGLSAGGTFSEIQRVEQEYIVEFFPQSDYDIL